MATQISSPVVIDVEWQRQSTDSSELYLSAFMLNSDGKVRDIKDIVYYGTLIQNQRGVVSVDESIVLSASLQINNVHGENVVAHNMIVELERVDPNIKRVVFVVSTDSEFGLDSYTNATFAMSFGGTQASPIVLTDNGDANIKCLIVGYIERHNTTWRFFEEGTAINGTLEEAYNEYATTDIRKRYPYEKFFSMDWLQKEQEVARILRKIREAENNFDFSSVITSCDELIALGHEDDNVAKIKDSAIKKKQSLKKYLQEAEDFVSKQLWDSAKNSAELALAISPKLERAVTIKLMAYAKIETSQKVLMFLQNAEKYYKNKDYKKSLLSVNEVLAIDSKNNKALNLLGKIKMAESSSKQTLKSLLNKLEVAKNTKDYEHALEICKSIINLDQSNKAKWLQELDVISGKLRLMSSRTVRKEIADIKAIIRAEEKEKARIKLLQLQQDLHTLDNHEYDEVLEGLLSDCSGENNKDKITITTPEDEDFQEVKEIDSEALTYLKKKDFRKAKVTFAKKHQSDMAQLCTELITKSKVVSEAQEILNKITPSTKNRYRADLRNILPKLAELETLYNQYEIPSDDIHSTIIEINNNF